MMKEQRSAKEAAAHISAAAGCEACKTYIYELESPNALDQHASSAIPPPKTECKQPSGFIFPILFNFRSTFFRSKNLLNFGSQNNVPQSHQNNFGTFLLQF